jgi:hypothetical protein
VLSRNDTKKVRPNTALVNILLRFRTVISRPQSAISCAHQLFLNEEEVSPASLLAGDVVEGLVTRGAGSAWDAFRVAATAYRTSQK